MPLNTCHANFGSWDPHFGRTGVLRGSAVDSASVISYRLSVGTMLLTEALWPQFTMLVFGGADSTPCWGMGDRRGSELVLQGSGQVTQFASSDSFSVRHTI